MKKERIEFNKTINNILNEYRTNTKIIDSVEKKLIKKGINIGIKVLNGSILIDMIGETQILYFITLYLYQNIGKESVNPKNFFTEVEIEKFEKIKKFTVEKAELVFKNMIKIGADMWVGKIEIPKNVKLWQQGDFYYNERTQRPKIGKMINGKFTEKIDLKTDVVIEITNAVKTNNYIPVDPIVYNIRRDGSEDYYFNDETGTLEITEGFIDCTDGFHRNVAFSGVAVEGFDYSSLNYKDHPIVITHFTEDKCIEMIEQQNKRTNVSAKDMKKKDNSIENYIINELKAKSNIKITDYYKEIGLYKAYVTRLTLYTAISKLFVLNKDDKRKGRKIADFLAQGLYDDIVNGVFKIEFDNLKDFKETSVATNNNMFYVYMTLLSWLYQEYILNRKTDWEDKLEEILENIDMSHENPKWEELGIYSDKDLSSRAIDNIIKYARLLIKEVE